MLKDSLRIAALGVAALAVFALAGCGAPNPQETPPPPMASEPAQPSADLMGGPSSQPSADSDEPESDEPDASATMQPIPNPEDMTPDQREHFYGHRYDYLDQPRQAHECHCRREAGHWRHHGWAHHHHHHHHGAATSWRHEHHHHWRR